MEEFKKERDLSDGVRLFLKDICLCQKTYGEVYNIDMVGLNGNTVFGVEMKLSLSSTVLKQARERQSLCNVVYIAIPFSNNVKTLSRIDEVKRLYLDTYGIGLILISKFDGESFVRVVKKAKLIRHPRYKKQLIDKLPAMIEDSDGGVTTAESYSPYKQMIDEVKSFLRRQRDGKTIKEIAACCSYVKVHYASPEGSLYQTLNAHFNSDWVVRNGNLYSIKEGF